MIMLVRYVFIVRICARLTKPKVSMQIPYLHLNSLIKKENLINKIKTVTHPKDVTDAG